MAAKRKRVSVWALVLGRPNHRFVAYGLDGLMATCQTRADLRGWMKAEGYDRKKVWPNARIVRLVESA